MAEMRHPAARSSALAALNGGKKPRKEFLGDPNTLSEGIQHLYPKDLTEEQKKAIQAGAARAWYADLPGAVVDIPAMALEYGAEGLKRMLPKNLGGYDFAKSLGVEAFQEGMRKPAGGSRHLEELGEEIGIIPPTTGMKEEEFARMAFGFLDPVPIPLTAGVFASKRAKTLPELSLAKAEDMEKARSRPQEIFQETGFFRGPEGQWRFEISDKDIKINPEKLKTAQRIWGRDEDKRIFGEGDISYGDIQRNSYAPLKEVVDHPELFKAYPELEEVYIKFEPPEKSGHRYRGYYAERKEYVPVDPLSRAIGDDQSPTDPKKVIALVAPTRQSEISRLEELIYPAKRRKQNAENTIQRLEGQAMASFPYSILAGSMKEMEQAKLTLKNSKEILDELVPELDRLSGGGKVDLPFAVKSTLTHELQHAIQDIENLPRGGSPETAFRETKKWAEKSLLKEGGMTRPKLQMEAQEYGRKLEDMYVLDNVHYLQQLQRFIMSDEPTRNARFIENSQMSYGLTRAEDQWLGPRPKRHRRKEYAEYLRKKARIYQAKIVDKWNKNDYKSNQVESLLHELQGYTDKKGKEFPENLESYYPWNIKGEAPGIVNEETNMLNFGQPNWLALGEKNVKNAVKRKAYDADRHREAAGLERKIVTRLKDLERMREDLNRGTFGYEDREFYKRLAGEAEARAVQERLQLEDQKAGGTGGLTKLENTPEGWKEVEYSGAGKIKDPEELLQRPPTDIYDVPKEELGFIYNEYALPSRAAARPAYAK